MIVNIILLISCLIILFLAIQHIYENLRIFRNASRRKDLTQTEIYFISFISTITLGFSLFAYKYFDDKDFRQTLREFKKLSLYADFLYSHSTLYLLLLAISPEIIWQIYYQPTIALKFYVTVLPFSLMIGFSTYFFQMPNFFDRRHTLTNADYN